MNDADPWESNLEKGEKSRRLWIVWIWLSMFKLEKIATFCSHSWVGHRRWRGNVSVFLLCVNDNLTPWKVHKKYGKRASSENWKEWCKGQMASGSILTNHLIIFGPMMPYFKSVYWHTTWLYGWCFLYTGKNCGKSQIRCFVLTDAWKGRSVRGCWYISAPIMIFRSLRKKNVL